VAFFARLVLAWVLEQGKKKNGLKGSGVKEGWIPGRPI